MKDYMHFMNCFLVHLNTVKKINNNEIASKHGTIKKKDSLLVPTLTCCMVEELG